MSDWIEHNGGPQPVGDDVWVEVQKPWPWDVVKSSRVDEMGPAKEIAWDYKLRYRILNQHLIDAARKDGLQKGLEAFDEARLAVEGDIQKLCDAARLEGIRLGLMAADKAIKALYVECPATAWRNALEDASMDVRNLKPETIAREAKPTA